MSRRNCLIDMRGLLFAFEYSQLTSQTTSKRNSGPRVTRFIGSCFVFACLVLAGQGEAAPINIIVNTSTLAGQTVDLAFDLTTSTANTATINPFVSDITQFGAITPSGDVSGTLPNAVTLGGTPNFHEYLQTVTLGSSLVFTFNTTSLPVDLQHFGPDDFAFFILVGGVPVDTGGPGGALFTFDFGIETPILALFSSATLPVRGGTPPSVPEPGELWLIAAAFLALRAVTLRRSI